MGGRTTTEFLLAGGVWDPLRGTTPRRAVAYNRLKRSECAAKINNISLADKKAAVRDPRRRGSDDVAGDAHVLDEGRDSDA